MSASWKNDECAEEDRKSESLPNDLRLGVANIKNSIRHFSEHTKKRKIIISYSNLSYAAHEPGFSVHSVSTAIKRILNYRRRSKLNILNDLSGKISVNKLTLLLGPPGKSLSSIKILLLIIQSSGSGKSTFLKALSGRLFQNNRATMSGSICYNGVSAATKKFVVSNLVDYIGQEDIHIPTLTVAETLEFAWRASSGGHHSYTYATNKENAKIFDQLDSTLYKVK